MSLGFAPRLQSAEVPEVNVFVDKTKALPYETRRLQAFLKRGFDIAASLVCLVLFVPALLVLALLVKLDSDGPAVYGATRLGRAGKTFKCFKFRTMIANADRVLHDYLGKHPELAAEWQATHKLKRDPRVTKLGAFLRSTSLDELPQLWNVLRGDMSFVGPRPIVHAEIPKYGPVYDLYKRVPTGITGRWQISGRNDVSYENRVLLDLEYMNNWNFGQDLIILAKTFVVVFQKHGAY